ncbi:MFS transporter [Acidiferrimicrobium sp. IK]|uniref:MFS transporter n=1 Tax=Acidiferrimicrobium sp. IK TaxID=2871700 RepID=UPI0021CB373F|nr:MFS transporter [Acidiferrimicrobium sp. IK]MCU4185269.1 MFS transporter [Acidiferrimicrobium sp. IK]
MDTLRTIPEDAPAPRTARRKGRWIDDWEPEDPAFWARSGRFVARRNLLLSMFAEHLGFSIWVVWTIVVLNLANIGIKLSVSEQFLLTLLPNLVGSLLRIPYTFAVPRFGGRAWTAFSASLLLVPALALAVVVPSRWLAHQAHGTQLWVLALCAATAGVGGGNFASSMANISYFYPERRKGWALGLNAAGGNIGTAVGQLVVPLVLIVGVPEALAKLPNHHVHMAYAGAVWIPFIVAAALLAWWRMDSLSQASFDGGAYRAALRTTHTWLLSFIYIGTFGSFIGFSFAMPLVIKYSFPTFLADHTFIATYLAGLGFTGALLGSLSRPLGGWIADRVGGAAVTLASFVGMAGCVAVAIAGVANRSFPIFFVAFQGLFVLSGIGNGSTYKMIPSVFAGMAAKAGGTPAARLEHKRRAAAVIGIAGAAGALGGVAVQVVIRQSSLHVSSLITAAKTPAAKAAVAAAHSTWSVPALWLFLGSYVVFASVTYAAYLRRQDPAGAEAAVPAAAVGA